MNADDWGRTRDTSDRIFECIQRHTVSAVSAMVFMEDSERAAALAREHGIDAGLHLNFTAPFSFVSCPLPLIEHQRKIAAHLLRHPVSRGLFHPGLVESFEYVVKTQRDEYARIYGAQPQRWDGHHHMHLCANVLLAGLLPKGTLVRRHFSPESSDKPLRNYMFRQITDVLLARRYCTVDYFFSLPPLCPPSRLERIFSLARHSVVEVETHPINPEEYRYLTSSRWDEKAGLLSGAGLRIQTGR